MTTDLTFGSLKEGTIQLLCCEIVNPIAFWNVSFVIDGVFDGMQG